MYWLLFVISFQPFLLCVASGQDSSRDCRDRYEREVQAQPGRSLPHFELAVCLARAKDRAGGVNQFREALNGDLQPSWIIVWSHVNLGKIFDATGQRERALNEYRVAVMTGDNTRGALDEARLYTEKPYRDK